MRMPKMQRQRIERKRLTFACIVQVAAIKRDVALFNGTRMELRREDQVAADGSHRLEGVSFVRGDLIAADDHVAAQPQLADFVDELARRYRYHMNI